MSTPQGRAMHQLPITRRQALRISLAAGGVLLTGCRGFLAGRQPRIAFEELQSRIAGTVVPRHAAAYEAARRSLVWNARTPQRFPDAIVRVASERDVQEAVRFAREHGLKVAIRGGGHNWNGAALRQGGLLLDLSALNQVKIDVASRTAVAQPVVTNRDFARQLAEHGLAFPVGHCPTVTLSGYLLGGGFGWNTGKWGVACFNVTGIDVVIANGDLVHASETENADLFWAARGAGSGFFGVVTRYHLRLFPLPANIETSTLIFPIERATEVVAWIVATVPTLPRNVEATLLYTAAPPPLAEKCRQTCIVMATAFAQSRDEAALALAPFATCPVSDCLMKTLNEATPWDVLFDGIDRALPRGKRYAMDSMWLNGDAVGILGKAASEFAKVPSPDSVVLALVLPPADVPLPDAAFSMVAPIFVGSYAVWSDPTADALNIRWLRDMTEALRHETVGHYIGEVDLTAAPTRAAHSFAKPNWERLQQLRARYDPDGVFHSYLEPTS